MVYGVRAMDRNHGLLPKFADWAQKQGPELMLRRVDDEWMLGNCVLKQGDVIEVLIDHRWYVARIQFSYEMNEYQLQFPLVKLPLCERDIARWPLETPQAAF